MALWEYKVISSGKGGFATPVLLEKFLNDLGKEQWEIIDFRTPPDNPLAFSGLARRPTQRDWTLEDAAAAAAKAEADKVRAEFEAKFKGMAPAAPIVDEGSTADALDEKVAPDDGFRKPIDTSHDQDPDAEDDDEPKDDWDKLVEEDELPTFFEAIRPHMRRNQRGPGTSVGVDYLAKKWGFDDADVVGALKECGFEIPEDENAKPAYLDYDGDLYWVNINRRGELWINTKEKPLPVFRVVPGQPIDVEEEPKVKDKKPVSKPAKGDKESKATAKPDKEAKPAEALPAGPELLVKIRPKMRRNRRDAGGSGSTSFLSRAFKCTEADLLTAFAGLGLVVPEKAGDKPITIEVGNDIWWLNKDKRGGVWINGREKKENEAATPGKDGSAAEKSADSTGAASEPSSSATETEAESTVVAGLLDRVRPLFKRARAGIAAGEIATLVAAIEQSEEAFIAALVDAGLRVPAKPREKVVCIEHAGESFWLSKNTKDQLLLNAKAATSAKEENESPEASADEAETKTTKKPRRPRSKKKSADKPAEPPLSAE